MANNKDAMVINTIQQLIREVKEEMKEKKVLTEGKTAQEVFDNRERDMKRYITENVLKALKDAEK